MCATTPREYHLDDGSGLGHPFKQYLWDVMWFTEDYPLSALAYVWFEIDQSVTLGLKNSIDNLFISDYDIETMNFLIETKDD